MAPGRLVNVTSPALSSEIHNVYLIHIVNEYTLLMLHLVYYTLLMLRHQLTRSSEIHIVNVTQLRDTQQEVNIM